MNKQEMIEEFNVVELEQRIEFGSCGGGGDDDGGGDTSPCAIDASCPDTPYN